MTNFLCTKTEKPGKKEGCKLIFFRFQRIVQAIILFSKAFRLTLRAAKPPILGVLGALSSTNKVVRAQI
jgi:hypothetical protein